MSEQGSALFQSLFASWSMQWFFFFSNERFHFLVLELGCKMADNCVREAGLGMMALRHVLTP